MLDGRRLYARRADLQAVIAVDDPARSAALADVIAEQAAQRDEHVAPIPHGCARRDVRGRDGRRRPGRRRSALADAELAGLALRADRRQVRDTLYALAVGDSAGDAESLWALLSRTLPDAVAGRGAGVARVQRLRPR